VAGVYRPRHPECTVLYRVLFHYFDQFLAEYESRFEKECGFLRPIIKDMDYLEFIARVTSYIPDKGQVTVRYFGLYANAHRGKVRKGQPDKHPFIIVEKENPRIPRRGWAEMIRKVYEVNPLTCPKCQGEMRIIAHLKLTFVAERPPPASSCLSEILDGLRGSS